MEVVDLSLQSGEAYSSVPKSIDKSSDIYLIQSAASFSVEDRVNTRFDDLYKALSISAQEVLNKLNQILKTELPEGVESLKPDDYTPEATADRIVNSITAFFDVYAKQNPDLEGEELLENFMQQLRSGVEQGFGDAFSTLEEIGAFQFEGVKSGVQKTKELIDSKLDAYEKEMRLKLGLDQPEPDPVVESVAAGVNQATLYQAGTSINLNA